MEQKAKYLGFQVFRHRNFSAEGMELHLPCPLCGSCFPEIKKLGPAAMGAMYIQLARFPTHYLVLVITEEDFRYALISVKVLSDTMFGNMIMEDIGWLDVRRIRGDRRVGTSGAVTISPFCFQASQRRKRITGDHDLRREDK